MKCEIIFVEDYIKIFKLIDKKIFMYFLKSSVWDKDVIFMEVLKVGFIIKIWLE